MPKDEGTRSDGIADTISSSMQASVVTSVTGRRCASGDSTT